MKKVSFIVLGAGQRGNAYSKYAASHPERMEIVGVAEPIDERRNAFRQKYNKENCALDWKDLLTRPKMADCAIISMQDQMHYEPALKAIELGYHLLLEKPMANHTRGMLGNRPRGREKRRTRYCMPCSSLRSLLHGTQENP